jgi:phage antirepressor YoqD-like protein
MNDLTTEKTMTVREVSEAMEVPVRTIHDAIDRIFPGMKKNGVTTYLSQQDIMEISKELKRSHNIDLASTRKVAITELEMAEKTMEVMSWLKIKVDQLNEENKKLHLKADVAEIIANADGLILPSDAGKQICGHPINFIHWMEDVGILFRRKNGGPLLPKSIFQERGYFKLKSREVFGEVREQTYFTGKGLVWICSKYREAHNLLPFPVDGVTV